MRPYHWLLIFLGFGVIAMEACAPDGPTDQGYVLVNPAKAHAVIDPISFMTAVGCNAVTDHADAGTIAIPMPTGLPSRFACGSVPKDSVLAAVGRYKAAVAASFGGFHMTTAGYWVLTFVSSRVWCETNGGSYGWEGGVMYYYFTSYGDCYNVDSYVPQWESSSGGSPPEGQDGGGAGGAPTSWEQPVKAPEPIKDSLTSLPIDMEAFMPDTVHCATDTLGLDTSDRVTRGIFGYCRGSVPHGSDSTKIATAIAAIRARGGVCATMGILLDSLLKLGHIRLADDGVTYTGASAQGMGFASALSIRHTMTTTTVLPSDGGYIQPEGSKNSYLVTLQSVLAHEADHMLDNRDPFTFKSPQNEHMNGTDDQRTLNEFACSDLP